MGDERRDIEVKVRLTATEYIALTAIAERLGLSQSSSIRMWIREAMERHAARGLATAESPVWVRTGDGV